MRDEHLSFVCVMWMIEAEHYMAFVSETFPESADKMGDIAGGLEQVHRIPLVDKHRHFFFCFIEGYIPDMILRELPDILFMYLVEERFDILVHMRKWLMISPPSEG